MRIPVYIPFWQIEDGDVPPPVLGTGFSHVLAFTARPGNPGDGYGLFGLETTLTGTAHPLAGLDGAAGPYHPTELRTGGIPLYWPAPEAVSGPLTVTGIITIDDCATAPRGFPEARGTVATIAESSLDYVTESPGATSWFPAPEAQQRLRPLGECPRWFPHSESQDSPHTIVTGIVVEVEVDVVDTVAGSAVEPREVRNGNTQGKPAARVRLFPDYADTVLWLGNPIGSDKSGLSAALVSALKAWEASYYASLTADFSWKSPELAAGFTATGTELAGRLADELGRDFEVEFASYEEGTNKRFFWADARAGNRAAAVAFGKLVAAGEAERARLELLNKAPGAGWYAYAPLSGTTFRGGDSHPDANG